jgi:hypothetical protein
MFNIINYQITLTRVSEPFKKIINSDTVRFEDLKKLCIYLKKNKCYKATIIQILVDLYAIYDPYRNMYIFSLQQNVNNPIEVQKNLSLIINIIDLNNIINDESLRVYTRLLINNMLMMIIYIYGGCNNTNPIIISSYYTNKKLKDIIINFQNTIYESSVNDEFVNHLIHKFSSPLLNHINFI